MRSRSGCRRLRGREEGGNRHGESGVPGGRRWMRQEGNGARAGVQSEPSRGGRRGVGYRPGEPRYLHPALRRAGLRRLPRDAAEGARRHRIRDPARRRQPASRIGLRAVRRSSYLHGETARCAPIGRGRNRRRLPRTGHQARLRRPRAEPPLLLGGDGPHPCGRGRTRPQHRLQPGQRHAAIWRRVSDIRADSPVRG